MLAHLRHAWGGFRRTRNFSYDGRGDGWGLRLLYHPRFGTQDGQRWVIGAGWTFKACYRGVMLQVYGRGFELHPHTDGPDENRVWLVELRRARAGGVFSCAGGRSWLNGRVWRFDGGRQEHGFSRIERGARVTLLYQRGQDAGGRAPW